MTEHFKIMGRKVRGSMEYKFQKSVVDYLNLALPPHSEFFHVPNGEKRDKATAKKLKAMGVKAGVPDLVILWAGQVIFIELKIKDKSTSKSQNDVIPALERAGGICFVCWKLEQVEDALAPLMPLRATVKGMKA